MYHVVKPDGSRFGPVSIANLEQMRDQRDIGPQTNLVDLATGSMIQAHLVPGLFPSFAWRDPDAQKLPPKRIWAAVLMYPFLFWWDWVWWVSWSRMEDERIALWEFAGFWGKVYVVCVWVVVAVTIWWLLPYRR